MSDNFIYFQEQYPQGTYSETITSADGKIVSNSIGWALYNCSTKKSTAGDVHVDTQYWHCRGVCVCINDQCIDATNNVYVAPYTQASKFTSKKCSKCESILNHVGCNARVSFAFRSTIMDDKTISQPFSATMKNTGKHVHAQCIVIPRKNNKKQKKNPPVFDPYFMKLVPNDGSSCFIDAVAEMLFRSVFPFFDINKLFAINNNSDLHLLASYRSFVLANFEERILALTTVRALFRSKSAYKAGQFGSAGEAFCSVMNTMSVNFQCQFTLKGMKQRQWCDEKHERRNDEVIHEPIMYTEDPLRIVSVTYTMKCKTRGCRAKAYQHQTTDSPLPLFLFFENGLADKPVSIFPFYIDFQGSKYIKHAVTYFQQQKVHYVVVTTIQYGESAFVALIDNCAASVKVLTDDPSRFEEQLDSLKSSTCFDTLICYKKQ